MMAIPGILRKMDDLGRVVIPQELRRVMGIHPGDVVELQLENGSLRLRKFDPDCIFCGGRQDLFTYENKQICGECLRKLRKV